MMNRVEMNENMMEQINGGYEVITGNNYDDGGYSVSVTLTREEFEKLYGGQTFLNFNC